MTEKANNLFPTATRQQLAGAAALIVSLAIALPAFFIWLGHDALSALEARVPGRDGRPAARQVTETPVDLAGWFQPYDGAPSSLPGAWPRFRGAMFDNIARDAPPLADAWRPDGPPVLWRIDVGEGYAGPAVHEGRVYLLDYDEGNRADALRCFSLDDGREIWRHSYKVEVRRNHGMSRTVPAIGDGYVVSIGPRCHTLCLDAATGAFHWGIDLQDAYGTQEPLWYTGQCPLIDGDLAILAPGGPDALLLAVKLATGETAWKTPNPDGWQMSHSSIMPMTLAGKRMYVYAATGGVAGVSAADNDMGALLWRVPWDAKIVAPSPVAVADDRILVLAGYGAGGMFIEVAATPDGFEARELSRHGPKEGIAAEQHTPIVHNGLIYSIMPKDAGGLRAQFTCFRPDGSLGWSSGQENRFGLGPWLLADGKFYVLDDEGMLYLIRASAERFELLDKAQVLHGHESWAPLALAGDRLLVRDLTQLACVAVGVRP
ncbi:MAG TPA: hypothetical protein ENN29_09595 [Candidatus Hydrogenedentes bacterium]|nr:hypothetical protein [Candidatus Hydrogenedentota bacterium]